MQKTLLRIEDVAESVSISVSKLRRMIRANQFPKPVRVGGNILWRHHDVETWAMSLVVEDKKPRGRPRLAV